MRASGEVGLYARQALLEDVPGMLVTLELDAMQAHWATTPATHSIDHGLLETNSRNAEEHPFLLSACQRFGVSNTVHHLA